VTHYPCCCGDTGCEFVRDDFSTDTLAANYSQISGSWTHDGTNDWITSASADAIIRHTTGEGGSNAEMLACGAIGLQKGEVGRLLLSMNAAATEYLYVEVERDATDGLKFTLRMRKLDGVTATTIGTDRTFNQTQDPTRTWIAIAACYDGDDLTVGVGAINDYRIWNRGNVPNGTWAGGPYVGFGKANDTDTIAFDDLCASKHFVNDSSCPDCEQDCIACTGDAPEVIQADVSGIAAVFGGDPCDCSSQDGTYYLQRTYNDPDGVPLTSCVQSIDKQAFGCTYYSEWLDVSEYDCDIERYRAWFHYHQGVFQGQTYWFRTFGFQYDEGEIDELFGTGGYTWWVMEEVYTPAEGKPACAMSAFRMTWSLCVGGTVGFNTPDCQPTFGSAYADLTSLY
jgi:hypothetical protein